MTVILIVRFVQVLYGRQSEINDHLETKKHASRGYIALKLAAKEVTFIHHTIVHNQSFNSMAYSSDLIQKVFKEKKCMATRT